MRQVEALIRQEREEAKASQGKIVGARQEFEELMREAQERGETTFKGRGVAIGVADPKFDRRFRDYNRRLSVYNHLFRQVEPKGIESVIGVPDSVMIDIMSPATTVAEVLTKVTLLNKFYTGDTFCDMMV